MSADRARASQGPRVHSPRLPLPWVHALLALLVASVALALRLHELGSESLWIDEAITHARASYDQDKLIRDTLRRKHVPTYFLLMHHLMPVLGDSEFALRLPSAVFGAGAATLSYAIGAVVAGPVAGLSTGLLMATAQSQIHYGQEARMYALVTFFAALGVLAVALLAREPDTRTRPPWRLSPRRAAERVVLLAWVLLFIGTLGPLYLHNTAVFYVAGMQVAGACLALLTSASTSGGRPGFVRNWILCQGLALLCWSPWVPHLLAQSTTFDRWKQRPFTWEMARGHITQILTLDQQQGPIPWILLVAVVVAVAAPGTSRRRTWVLIVWPLTALGLCAFISMHKANMMFVRTLLWTAVPTFAVAGAGLARLPRGTGLLGLAVLLWLNAETVRDYYRETTKPPWREFMQELTAHTDDSSLIIGTGASRFVHYYQRRKDDPLPHRRVIHFNRQKRLQDVLGNAQRFWWIAKTNSTKTARFKKMLRRSHRYKQVFRRRKRAAMLLQYELKDRGDRRKKSE